MIIVNDSIHMTRGEFFIHYFWLEIIVVGIAFAIINKNDKRKQKKRGFRK